jgi:hypothetical protein
MFTEIELENIRIFAGAGWKFTLRPLTVFCGVNSSGKSTILKTLPLLRQSQGIHESSIRDNGKLRFVGSQVDMGDFRSLVSHNDTSRDISIGLTIKDNIPTNLVDELRTPGIQQNVSEMPSDDENIIDYFLKSKFTFSSDKLLEPTEDIPLPENYQQTVNYASHDFLNKAQFELLVDEQVLLSWELVTVSDKGRRRYQLVVPSKYLPMEADSSDQQTTDLRLNISLQGLLPSTRLLRVSLVDLESLRKLPGIIFGATRDLETKLAIMRYIGPIRSPARRYYITEADARPPMDAAGEFLPYILKEPGRYSAWYVAPGEDKPKRDTLTNALNLWLYYIRTGVVLHQDGACSEIETESTKALVELRVKNIFGNELHALADSGFGYSQVLPILVSGLGSLRNNTIIVEQPELHLNPALQVRLGEFFVSLVKAGKQILIETHSEHIVNTIRVLTAEDETGELSKLCSIHYIDMDSSGPVTHELSVRPDGIVPDWPHQFFGEAASLTGRLLRAQRRFRKVSLKN